MIRKIFLLCFILIAAQSVYTQKTIGGGKQPKDKSVTEKRIKDQLIGTWSLVLVDNISPDGKRTKPYGENPQGLLVFDKTGNYSLQILLANRAKFASNDKTKGTDEENKSLVLGSNSHFGKYVINALEQTITFKIEHAFFPNWEGTEQIRPFTLTAQEFRYTVPTTTNGAGVSGEVVWKKSSKI
jgi:Lipocalin-like domain